MEAGFAWREAVMRPAILILTLFLSVDGFLFGFQNTHDIGDQIASMFRQSRGMLTARL